MAITRTAIGGDPGWTEDMLLRDIERYERQVRRIGEPVTLRERGTLIVYQALARSRRRQLQRLRDPG